MKQSIIFVLLGIVGSFLFVSYFSKADERQFRLLIKNCNRHIEYIALEREFGTSKSALIKEYRQQKELQKMHPVFFDGILTAVNFVYSMPSEISTNNLKKSFEDILRGNRIYWEERIKSNRNKI